MLSRRASQMFFRSLRLFRKAKKNRKHEVCDARDTGLGPLEAYYEHNGAPSLIRVDLSHCRWYGASGISYSRDSPHPYIQTLIEYEEGICTTYDGSFLQKYWQHWSPKSLAEYFGIDQEECHPLLLRTPPIHNILPWSPSNRIEYMEQEKCMSRSDYRELCLAGGTPARSCGPKPDWFGEIRFRRLVSVYESIKGSGYREMAAESKPYGDQHILGNCLVRDGITRFVVANGQHRAAGLSALGHSAASMIVHINDGKGPAMVRRDEVGHWPLVGRNIFTPGQAEAIFDRIFDAAPLPEIESMKSETSGTHQVLSRS